MSLLRWHPAHCPYKRVYVWIIVYFVDDQQDIADCHLLSDQLHNMVAIILLLLMVSSTLYVYYALESKAVFYLIACNKNWFASLIQGGKPCFLQLIKLISVLRNVFSLKWFEKHDKHRIMHLAVCLWVTTCYKMAVKTNWIIFIWLLSGKIYICIK